MTPTQQLLAFAVAPPPIPNDVRAAARRLLADTLAVGRAGRNAPDADAVLAAASRWGTGKTVPVMGRHDRLPAPAAAFVNGFQIHALEWDAVHELAVVHALSVVTAALHAICHAGRVNNHRALDALIVGVEVACMLGVAATGPLRFFRPATAGLVGAALAGAYALALPPDRFDDVLGLACGQCAGTMQAHVEGSVGLPLQIAAAARAAVTAVDLVAAGLTGPHDGLEGPFGYFSLIEAGALGPVVGTLGSVWRTREIAFKPWPCGRASHGVLGALVGETPATVAEIRAEVPPLVARLVGRDWADDMTPSWARLCLPFLIALMLREGTIDPRRFTAAHFRDPSLRAIGSRLRLSVDSNMDPNALIPQRVILVGADRAERVRDVGTVPGAPGHSANGVLANAKFDLIRTLGPQVAPIPNYSLEALTGHP